MVSHLEQHCVLDTNHARYRALWKTNFSKNKFKILHFIPLSKVTMINKEVDDKKMLNLAFLKLVF